MEWVPLHRFRGKMLPFYRIVQANLYDDDWSTAPAMREKWALAVLLLVLAGGSMLALLSLCGNYRSVL